jgi:hypothetical protein
MPPSKWKELSSVVEGARRSSDKEKKPSPFVIEDDASSSGPAKASKDRVLGGLRRSERVRIQIPVDVYLCGEDEEPIFGHGKTVDVSAHGALLALPLPVEIGQTLRLVHRRTKREIECHVLRFSKRYPHGGGEVGVEFAGMSPHFWDIATTPEDWAPDWVPNALPQRLEPKVPPQAVRKGAAGATSRTEKPQRGYFGVAVGTSKAILKNSSALRRPIAVLAGAIVLLTVWIALRGSSGADSADSGNAVPAGVAPEDARRIPRIERTRLATAVDFDPDAVSWLRSSDQQPTGKIPGYYSGSKKSAAYILVGKANERRVVIFADGELRYNAEYPVIAIAACVPMELVHQINWAEPSTPQSDGDGLLIVRAADAPASGVILFVRGSQVVSASPVDYREVKFGQSCQP